MIKVKVLLHPEVRHAPRTRTSYYREVGGRFAPRERVLFWFQRADDGDRPHGPTTLYGCRQQKVDDLRRARAWLARG
jgi:hypothetical protein